MSRSKHLFKILLFVAIAALGSIATVAIAGTGGTEFASAYTLITGWVQGELGRLLAVGLLIVGLGMGMVKQTVMAAVPAVAAGLMVAVAPTIIGAIVTATI